jgi:hypothetical protein
MSEWAWVLMGYTTTGVAVGGYVLLLLRRATSVRRRKGDSR